MDIKSIYESDSELTEPIEKGKLYLVEVEMSHSAGASLLTGVETQMFVGDTVTLLFGSARETSSDNNNYFKGISIAFTANSSSYDIKKIYDLGNSPSYKQIIGIYKIE